MEFRKFIAMSAFYATAVVVFVACGDKNEAAKPSGASEAPAPAAPAAEPAKADPVSGQLALSPENTKIQFVGAKMIGSHDGAFQLFTGTVGFKDSDPKTAVIKVEIDMSSVKTDDEKLDGHLKSPDFFDVEKFPKAVFESAAVTEGGADGVTHTVRGDLTLHGVKKSLEIPAKINVDGKKVTVDAELSINRKDFGIVYPGMPDNLIKDDVMIKLAIDGTI